MRTYKAMIDFRKILSEEEAGDPVVVVPELQRRQGKQQRVKVGVL